MDIYKINTIIIINLVLEIILKGYDKTSSDLEENYREELVVSQYIQPEISYSKKGYEWIEKIFDAIYNKSAIEIKYQKLNKEPELKIISPQLPCCFTLPFKALVKFSAC